ncbi:hypothetical protein GUJ93_ZPchr0014g46537 [Zizania palustris]|uniref:Uncharacterized protein n=1 Tax=Zizania palustris TaxID=103762 RepID=A0A8J5TAW2_ZIZPA|nr:hypothetical protein GUJ93_ZPchr0014g46537 [Zizania palustris]
MMEKAEDLRLSLSLSSSLAPRAHHVDIKRSEVVVVVAADEDRAGQRGGGSDEEDGGCSIDGGSRKKLRLSKDQSAVLEDSFREHPTLNPDEAEADGGGLRVPEALLRDAHGGEPAAAEGGARAARAQARLAAPLHEHVPAHHPHHVPPPASASPTPTPTPTPPPTTAASPPPRAVASSATARSPSGRRPQQS